MDENFFVTDFSLEDIDFDYNIYQENTLSVDEANMNSQVARVSSNLEFLGENPKPMMKIKNKPRVISFSSNVSNSSPLEEEIIMDRLIGHGTKRKASSLPTRSPILAKEHVIAERKRREKLSQKFIALSALLPGLRKADKVTVLDDAIARMKQLQEKIRKLKEEKDATKEVESLIIVKKSKVFLNEEHEKSDQALPEIEAKVAQNKVLIRIHCEKSKGCMINILNTIENLQLRIENSFILPFGDSTLNITVLAQMEKEFSASVVKDLVRNLRLAMV